MLTLKILQELQLNILQQTHLMQAGERAKSSPILQQLQTKQQQLTAQLQLAQHALTLNMLIQTNGGKEAETGTERDRHRSETQYSSDGSTKENQNNNNSSPLLPPGKINGNRYKYKHILEKYLCILFNIFFTQVEQQRGDIPQL